MTFKGGVNELENSEDFDLALEKAKVKIAELYKEKKRLENDLKFQVKKKRKLEEKYKSQNWLSRLDFLIDLKLQDWTSMDWKISFFLLMIVVVILSVIIRNIILGVVMSCIGLLIFVIIDDKRNPEVLNNFILKEIEIINTKVNYIQKRIDEINRKVGKLSSKDTE